MDAKERDWWVFSTATRDVVLMVECQITGAFGIIRNPTQEEWDEAFHAPSAPYPWMGEPSRVEVVQEGPPVWRVRNIMFEKAH